MMTDHNACLVLRFGGIERTFLAVLFALMVTLTALPVSIGQPQDNRARQDRGSSVAQAPSPKPMPRSGPDAPAPGNPRLTLDQAVDRLEQKNQALAAMWLEVLQTRTDILTAGQRPDCLLFIGGGKDGPLRLWALDLPLKLWARAISAHLAARVTEAQYRDAVRTRTADLYTAYVDVQEAHMQARVARSSVTGFEQLKKATELLAETGQIRKTELDRIAAAQARSMLAAADAALALRKAQLFLANLLNVLDAEAELLEVSELTEERERPLPAVEELTRLALGQRPDLHANRLGFWRSQADWLRTWVDQWPDLYILAEPNRPGRADAGGVANAVARASGLLVSIRDADHYRGRVARAQINVAKWRIELERVERQVVLDVRQAHLEYTHSLTARRRLKEEVLPSAKNVRDESFRLFKAGEGDIQAYLHAQSDYNDVVADCLKAAIRHRRAALTLNTAVATRVVP